MLLIKKTLLSFAALSAISITHAARGGPVEDREALKAFLKSTLSKLEDQEHENLLNCHVVDEAADAATAEKIRDEMDSLASEIAKERKQNCREDPQSLGLPSRDVIGGVQRPRRCRLGSDSEKEAAMEDMKRIEVLENCNFNHVGKWVCPNSEKKPGARPFLPPYNSCTADREIGHYNNRKDITISYRFSCDVIPENFEFGFSPQKHVKELVRPINDGELHEVSFHDVTALYLTTYREKSKPAQTKLGNPAATPLSFLPIKASPGNTSPHAVISPIFAGEGSNIEGKNPNAFSDNCRLEIWALTEEDPLAQENQ